MNATDTISGVPEHAGRCAGDIMYLIRCCALLWQEEHGMLYNTNCKVNIFFTIGCLFCLNIACKLIRTSLFFT